MHPTLLESDRSFFQIAECAVVSILAHVGLLCLALGATEGGRQLPTDEREARVFFLLPPDLLAIGAEGLVQATYVVDTIGLVDTTTITVEHSDDPRFTESVLTALGQMRFRPAKRGGTTVRQLVEQQFRFRIQPASQVAK